MSKCPSCGGYKKPWYKICYNCHVEQKRESEILFLITIVILCIYLVIYFNLEKILSFLKWLGLFLFKIIVILFIGYILYKLLLKKK